MRREHGECGGPFTRAGLQSRGAIDATDSVITEKAATAAGSGEDAIECGNEYIGETFAASGKTRGRPQLIILEKVIASEQEEDF